MRRVIGCLCAVVVGLSLPMAKSASAASVFTVTFVDVGQGDAAIYRGSCGDIGVVDIPDGKAGVVADHLSPFPNPSVKWVAASHYHDDHIGGIDDFLAVQDVSAVYDRGGDRNVYDSVAYRSYYDVATSVPGVRDSVDIGDTFSLCSGDETVTFTVVSAGTDGTAVGGVAVSDENDRGLCLKVTYQSFSLATCGDINGTTGSGRADVETPAASAIGAVDLVKVNHHGSGFSSNQTWVDTLHPRAAIFSVGANGFGHPSPAVIDRWGASGAAIWQTDVHGDVHASFDADTSSFTVNGTVFDQGQVSDPHDPLFPPLHVRSIGPACDPTDGFEDGFDDVPSSNTHEAAVDCAVYWQVTTGVSPGVYAPGVGVTRGQMASFVARFVERSGGTLPDSPPDAFADDDGTTHETSINKLAAVGVVSGRGDGTYGQRESVTRAHMAAFIIRALEYRLGGSVTGGGTPPDYFTDDDGDTHEPNINKAASIGITGGTGGANYGPTLLVRRDQMASFLARGLAYLVEIGAATVPDPPPKCSHDSSIEQTDSSCQPCPHDPSVSASDAGCAVITDEPTVIFNCPQDERYTTADGSCVDSHDVDGNGDVNCSEIAPGAKPVQVHDPDNDPHQLDADGDGVGCEF